jgi:phospholipid/cholesterol/gamma-HCH transport system substrate-binding protein
MSDLAENTEALKRSFFFRGFFKKRGYYDLDNVTVAEYREGKLAHDKSRQQAWIHETELLAQSTDGSEELSAAGKKQLDAVMAEFQRYPRNGALIVEGYSGKGLPGEQLSLSTDRALKVREYLVKKFHLDPNYVGTMPMGSVASKDEGRDHWEGVAIVVLYDKAK